MPSKPRPGENLPLGWAALALLALGPFAFAVDVLHQLPKIPHIEPLPASWTFHVMIGLGLSDAVWIAASAARNARRCGVVNHGFQSLFTTSARNPSGISGVESSSFALQIGQGAPAPPQVQA
jgi:hypothetical protein